MTVSQTIQGVKQLEQRAQFLHPGEWAVEKAQPLATLLGSCVTVCLFDPRAGFGGMNHFLLPKIRRPVSDPDIVLAGDYAMEVLVNALMARGASKRRLVAKAFGGANVTGAISSPIGDRNAQFTTEWLAREGIPLLANDLGGRWPRKVVFLPWNGDVYCRRQVVQTNSIHTLLSEEERYRKQLDDGLGASSVELY